MAYTYSPRHGLLTHFIDIVLSEISSSDRARTRSALVGDQASKPMGRIDAVAAACVIHPAIDCMGLRNLRARNGSEIQIGPRIERNTRLERYRVNVLADLDLFRV